MSFPLTKSHFLAGLQCPKHLWLAVCKPEYACPISLTQQWEQEEEQRFRTMAQGRFRGIAIGGALHSALEQTQTLLREGQTCLFDAAFIFDDIFFRAHILRRRPDQGWQLWEAKPTPKIQKEHLAALALQTYVLNGAGIEVTEMGLILGNPQTTAPKKDRLTLTDATQSVQMWQSQIPDYLSQFRQFLTQSAPPSIPMGDHCDYPHLCPFKAHCQGDGIQPLRLTIPQIFPAPSQER
jgi:hypothetical protein